MKNGIGPSYTAACPGMGHTISNNGGEGKHHSWGYIIYI